MKEFKTLEDGLFFHEECILCNQPIRQSLKYDFNFNIDAKPNYNFDYYLWSGLWINVDIKTGYIKVRETHVEYTMDGTLSPIFIKSFNPTPPKSGKEYFCYSVNCNNCMNFYYALQIIFDWKTMVVDKILLNSESVSFIDEKYKYIILNNYTNNTTNYSSEIYDYESISFSQIDPIRIPLVELNYKNPRKTLNKVKKLVIFS